mmetsp:Transcript_39267/g.85415  ORF Transcript_39267/g.85415 Transcript_39267/m.85415 type:complete len:354 (-) Transcript_39267:383-1444(-)|eukprot:CAMPEP_0118933914 /NCGR_PEP_ID=MMETSP1169-20130426/12976_1 /TAXON_ID=36882 /ORGANISM="Pyramimonas obovata, Strain CCMP722" /LENGTH=353 /DNA_ID=CAMNT_0006876745 /DNA_START=221 /DNA_END=1282 /DNA_ORIENTATION=+
MADQVDEELLMFMRGIKLDKFLATLHDQGVNTIDDLKFVDREIMDACGFSTMHRKKFEEGWNKRDAAKREFLERSAPRLFEAARKGEVGMVRSLLKLAGAQVNCQDHDHHGYTPLHEAAAGGHTQIVQTLLAYGASPDFKANKGFAPLHLAAADGCVDTVRAMVNGGAFIDVQENKGRTPLHLAAGMGHRDTAMHLLAVGAEVDIRDNEGDSPLLWAAAEGHASTVQALLKGGARINLQSNDGQTALHMAARWGHTETAQVLIAARAKVDLQNNDGDSPLLWAAAEGHVETARALVTARACVDLENRHGKTPLDVADYPFSEHAEQMKALLRAYHVFDLGPSFDTGGEDNFLI